MQTETATMVGTSWRRRGEINLNAPIKRHKRSEVSSDIHVSGATANPNGPIRDQA